VHDRDNKICQRFIFKSEAAAACVLQGLLGLRRAHPGYSRESRQIENGLRKQLAGAELQVVQQRLDSAAREVELRQQLRQAEREQDEAAVQGGFQTPKIQQLIHRRSLGDVAFIQQQQLENYRLGVDRARLQRENRELARVQSAARSEAEDARQELARLKKKEHNEQA
jgi:hypothetical protein